MKNEINYPRVLLSTPCNEDLFEGGAHQRLAKEIANEIDGDENCSIVGIDGGWGSGKSNLVGLICKELEADEMRHYKYYCFTYDAWGHQNDAYKRTILEELVSELVNLKSPLLKGEQWKKDLEGLLSKRKTTNTKTVPALNAGMIVTILLLFSTPFLHWLSTCFDVAWLSALCLLLPYILAYVITFICHYQKMRKKYDQRPKFSTIVSEFFLIYADKIEENTRYEVISETEPTSQQFKQWILKINNDLKNNNYCLLLVFDNMDRLPQKKVHDLWAAIHTFFSETRYSNIRVIVPFDRKHVQNAFKHENIDSNDENISFGDDFINKTFYIVYRVPQPILSDWKSYFKMQWKNAFGPVNIIEDTVVLVFDLLSEKHTPRSIIAFINEFVILKKIVDPKIPDKYIALFILTKLKIDKTPTTEILAPTYIKDVDFLFKDDDNFATYMSSLYYQLPCDKALDVVYVSKFITELNTNTPDSLLSMCKHGDNRFWSILDGAIPQVSNIPNTILALDACLQGEETKHTKDIWDAIYSKLHHQNINVEFFEPYQKILLAHITKQQQYWSFLRMKYIDSFKNPDFSVENYVNGIDEMSKIKGLNVYEQLGKKPTAVMPSLFLQLVKLTHTEWQRYGMRADEDLDDALSKYSIEALASLTEIPYIKEFYKLSKYKTHIEELIKTNLSSANNEERLLSLYREVDNEAMDITKYITDQQICNLYSTASPDFKFELIAMRISRYHNWSVSGDSLSANLKNYTDEIIKKVATSLSHYTTYGVLLINLKNVSEPLYKDIASYLTNDFSGRRVMNLRNVMLSFDTILTNSAISSEELIKTLNAWNNQKDSITIADVPKISIRYYKDAVATSYVLSEHLLKLADEYLTSMTQQRWRELLQNKDSFEYKLLDIYHPKNYQNCYDAMMSLLDDYIHEKILTVDKEMVSMIFTITVENKRKLSPYIKTIRDMFINGANMTSGKFIFFGDWLFDYGSLIDKNDSLAHIIPTTILSNANVLSIVENHADVVAQMIHANQEGTDEFISKLQALEPEYVTDESFVKLCVTINPEWTSKNKE